MNLTHLQYFVAAIETGSYSKAARAFEVTQPAISTAIKRLEEIGGISSEQASTFLEATG